MIASLPSILAGRAGIFIFRSLFLVLILLLGWPLLGQAQQQKYTLSGYVKDASSGETLPGANIYVKDNPVQGASSNNYGFYSLTLPEGTYQLVFSYLGYGDKEYELELMEDQRLNVNLKEGITIEEIVVTAEELDENVEGTQMGQVDLQVEKIKRLPALLGEVDILKTIQLLPGVLSAGEGTAGFYVRGGGPDQNLVLLDEAVVYNSGHMLGFFSVFNADAIKNTTLIKGGMPAYYGGRISSVVDIQMKEGNNKHYEVEGGVGLIASRLTVQGPIQEDRSSFILSGRRTYIFDIAGWALNGSDFDGTNYYFYDLNAKVNHTFSDKDRLYLSAYFGRDVLNFNTVVRDFNFRLPYGNATATLRWNHLFSDQLFMNVSAIYNDYDFSFRGQQDDFTFNVFSGVRDLNTKVDFDYYPNSDHNLRFGINYTYHKLTPNVAQATSGEEEFTNGLDPKYANETAIYLQDDFKVGGRWRFNVGLRASIFTQLGPYTSPINGRVFEKGDPVITYTGLEPRVSAKFTLSETSSLKAGFSYGKQYLHLVSNSTSTLPTDIWVPSTELVEPQIGIQYALGYFRNFEENAYESSIEVYYKDLKNQIDYGESYVNDIAVDVESGFVFGEGRSFGAEFFLKKNKGDLNGWIGYTLSKTDRKFPDIRNGERYPARFDRRHDLSVVLNYELSPKWNFGAVFVYGTGNTFTPLKNLYFIEQNLTVNYGDRNSARLSAYHRLDLSATLTPKPGKERPFQSSWTLSIYNAYNNFNTFFIFYDTETDEASGTANAEAVKFALFPIIPTVTWNFNWNQG
ncbi:MAG: TonB-dependent receptor, partial [Bacteroidota bacterium]